MKVYELVHYYPEKFTNQQVFFFILIILQNFIIPGTKLHKIIQYEGEPELI